MAALLFMANLWAADSRDNTSKPPIPGNKQLEAEGAIIGKITYKMLDIFNTELPEEDKALYRAANKLHIRTHRSVIQDQLLFSSGEKYSEQVVAETERILRANRYIQDVRIYPTAYHDGIVDLEVTTRDVWTLHPGASFGRKGGENSSRIELEETNLLGTGAQLTLSQRDTVDRTERFIRYADNHFFRNWWRLEGKYADNSDGYEKLLQLEHPFYSLNTRIAGGISLLDGMHTQPLYDLGEITDQFAQKSRYFDMYIGWSTEGLLNNWARRWTTGVTYDENRFAMLPNTIDPGVVPEDRLLIYPWIAFELIENEYHERRNYNMIGRTEDFFLGTNVSVKLAYASKDYGSDRDAIIFSAAAGNGMINKSGDHTLILGGEIGGRVEDSKFVNTLISPKASYYWKQSESRLLYLTLQGDYARKLDAENQLLIGGDSGLRGYPLRFQSGNKRALFTIEQRFYTEWYPWRLFRVGSAMFFDAGRAWGINVPDDEKNRGILKDVGFGLRLGNTRSGKGNVIHLDISFPLDGDSSIDSMQLSIETKAAF